MRVLVFSAIAIAAALAVPAIYRDHPDFLQALFAHAPDEPRVQTQTVAVGTDAPTGALSGRKVRIEAGRGGHFIADFRINGRSIEAMVDTGATMVAVNQSTARRIGLTLSPADFKYTASTANGQTKAAAARIDDMQIGRIRLENVDAAVLEDKALSGVLVGMSFLKRLGHYEVVNGDLVLEQ